LANVIKNQKSLSLLTANSMPYFITTVESDWLKVVYMQACNGNSSHSTKSSLFL